jgi:hypothetical protein
LNLGHFVANQPAIGKLMPGLDQTLAEEGAGFVVAERPAVGNGENRDPHGLEGAALVDLTHDAPLGFAPEAPARRSPSLIT